MELVGIHPKTAQLAIQLQLADVESALQESDEGDQWTAWKTLQDELERALLLLQDQIFAMDLLRQDQDNRAVFAEFLREERQAEEDHDLACRLSGIADEHVTRSLSSKRDDMKRPLKTNDDHQDLNSTQNFDLLTEPLAIINAYEPTEHNTKLAAASGHDFYGKAGPSKSKAKGKERAKVSSDHDEHATHILCSACMEPYPRFDALELCCKRPTDDSTHAYCRTCLSDLIHTSLADTTLFPPRCCGKLLPISRCKQLCPPSLLAQYEDKQMELATPNPVYCSNRHCAKFIKPDNITADTAVCQACQKETCALCQNPRHNGVCPRDPSIQRLIEVANKEEWQRCPNCRTLVELTTGCYHMRCRCGTQFCYLCATLWKTCTCPQWDERRLLTNGKVENGPRSRIAMPEEGEIPELDPNIDILEDMRMRLATVAGGYAIANDEDADEDVSQFAGKCDHKWERTYGKHGERETCGICHHHLKFVNSCTRCMTRACNRCLNNRL